MLNEKFQKFGKKSNTIIRERFPNAVIYTRVSTSEQENNFSLETQLEKCENIIHKALKAKIHKLVIIHGKGQGVLRNEVHNLLYSFRLDFKDSDYMRYSGGATDVFFR